MTEQQKNEMQERARAYALCSSLDSNEQGKINRAYIEGAKWAKERFKFVLRDGLHYDAIPRDTDNYPLEYRENAREYVLNTPHDYDSVEDTEDIAQLMECAYCQGMADRDNIGRWISVDEELPEEGIYVATLDNGGRNDIRHFYNGKWFGRFGNEYRGITHWLPLPAPPSCSVFPNNYKKGTVSNSERVAVVSKKEIAKNATVDAPLTAEILLKNGFKQRKQGGAARYILTASYYDVYVTEYPDGWWFVEYEDSERGDLPTERIAVRNIHQLQNALRLFGVFKEIKL